MIEREVHGEIAVLRLAHGKASALDLELLLALDAALEAEEHGPQRALVLTGTGTIFCAGVDLKRIVDGGAAYVEAFLPALDRVFARLFFLDKPVVAAMNGHAIAGGAVIALACDRRLLTRGKGMVGTPELKVGVPFPLLALEILRAALPPGLVADLVLEGKSYAGDECLARGLIHELVGPEALLPRALQAAELMAAPPSESFRVTKRGLRSPSRLRLDRELASSQATMVATWSHPETLAAVAAYVERTLRR